MMQPRPRHAFDIPEVQAFLASQPADEERERKLQALADAQDALGAARARDAALTAEIAANTEALVQATGKERDVLLIDRARHTAERDALPGMLEILVRRYVETVIAACQYVHRQARQVHDEADAEIAQHSPERTELLNALTRFESQSQYNAEADATRAELRALHAKLQPSRARREKAREVISFIEGTLHGMFGEGPNASYVQPDSIERYVRRATRKVA